MAEVRREWFKTLKDRRNEVLDSMKKEGIIFESAYLDKQGKDYFVIYYLKAADIEKAYEVFANSTLPIDEYFKTGWNKYFEGRIVLEELLDLDLL